MSPADGDHYYRDASWYLGQVAAGMRRPSGWLLPPWRRRAALRELRQLGAELRAVRDAVHNEVDGLRLLGEVGHAVFDLLGELFDHAGIGLDVG